MASTATQPETNSTSSGWVYDSLATGVVFALLLTVGQRAIGFARGILFCRLMTDQQLGQWSMVWSYLMLLAPLAMLGLPGCFGKYTEHYRQRGQLRDFVVRIGMVSLTMAGLVSLAIFFFPETVSVWMFRDPGQVGLVRFLALALLAVAISNYTTSLMESLRQIRLVTLMRFITGVGFAICGVLMLLSWQQHSAAVTVAYAICSLLGIVPAIWFVWKFRSSFGASTSRLSQSSMWTRIAPFAMWLWVSNLLHNLFELTDRTMLIHWSQSSADIAQGVVGQYHSGRVVPLLLVSVATMLGGVLMPYMSAHWESGRKDLASRQANWSIKLTGLVFTALGSIVLLVAPLLFEWILQGRYNDGLAVLPMTLVYCIWFSLYTVGQDYLWVAEKGKMATLAVGIGLIANIFLNILLIPSFGLTGAVLATSGGNLLALVLIFLLNHGYGCKTDPGIWMVAMVPVLLLLQPVWACAAMLILGLISIKTECFFSTEEREQLNGAWQNLRNRFSF